ncbi:DUF4232 domain-containing protein [Brevundimonas viscosa]|uniref:Membrane-bound inhibitor of C-type lysozyme n=1 Tax=Brevundimonas viscosa TaxID=871741 RepID=A0A1I6QDL3_9CAUL|nr:DUF4232 domain-containing protein [Brevundimonas viscosa]SFS50566.1 Membrane-bound inhibitor of C-type lysozyme [Brevundimonas viscosa]
MRSLTAACALVSSFAFAAACTEEAAAPPEPVTPQPVSTAPSAPRVSYACESGQSVVVAYPDTATARLSYRGQDYVLRTAQSASGARFVGSGVEWWIASRGDTENATLSRLGPNEEVGTAVLERCSRPASGPVSPGPAPIEGSGLVPASAPPCRGPQLRLSNEGGDAGAGNRVANIGLQNVGTQPCSLTGYPTVTLQDAQGRNLTAVRSEQATGSYFTPGQPPAPVVLAPQARAAFELAWSAIPDEAQGERTCPNAARVRVLAPGDTSPASLTMNLAPCGGRVKVSPIRPLAGAPQPAPEPTV